MANTIGFIGVGHMGSGIADRLLDMGNELVIYDLRPDAAAAFADRASVAESPRAVADAAAIVLASLPAPEASLAVAAEIAEGDAVEVYVETSTMGRPAAVEIAAIMAEAGIGFLDAPVSGGPAGARKGTMSIMISGAEDALERARPVLHDAAGNVFVVGEEPGASQIIKLVNNAIGFAAFITSCEALVLGVKAGADAKTMVDVINVSTGRNSGTEEKIPDHILPRTFDYGAPLKSAMKDFELYLAEAKAQGLPAWTIANVVELYRLAISEVGPDEDFTAFIKLMEGWAGVEVKG